MKMYTEPQPLEKYLDLPLECPCGRTHYAPIKYVAIKAGALEELPGYTAKLGYERPFIVCDEITYKIAGKRCKELLEGQGIEASLHIITHLGFDEATLGELLVAMPAGTDLILAVGTGSITDMIRYMSYKLSLPCFTVATAAPMDGFAASIGIMNVNGLKATMPAHNTQAIFGDTEILKNAPYRMSAAGFGDLIGKLTCLNDWELAHIITGEHICPGIVELVRGCVEDMLKGAQGLKDRDPKFLGKIMEGLVLSGTAISLYGDSRPASGAEHHMSHYWETIMDQRGQRSSMHGEQVAVGTVAVLMLAQELRGLMPDFDRARAAAQSYNRQAWEREIRRCYGPAAGEVLLLEEKAGKNRPDKVLQRIDSMERNWPKVQAQLGTLPRAEDLYALLRGLDIPASPAQIGIGREDLKDTFMYCKELRPRYTIFQTLYDLDLLHELSDKAIARLEALD